MLRSVFSFILCAFYTIGSAQTIGGSAAYSFINLPSHPLITAAGGMIISYRADEAGLTAFNPALLDVSMNEQISAAFTHLPGSINTYSLTGVLHSDKLNTDFGGHIFFTDYGSIPQT